MPAHRARGAYTPGSEPPQTGRGALLRALHRLDLPIAMVQTEQGPAVARGGQAILGATPRGEQLPLLAWVPALPPDRLGDPDFLETYRLRVPYVAGAMANGIGSTEIVIALARAGMMGFFGAAGLSIPRIAAAIDEVQSAVGELPYGFNLIHSPQEPRQEQRTVDLYLERGVRTVSASAYLRLTPPLVQYRAAGLRRGTQGEVIVLNRLLAKVSREEVAAQFLAPAPAALLERLVRAGRLQLEQAELAARVPMADDLTAEADSGGHTDRRSAAVLLPLLCELRDRVVAARGGEGPVRIGAAGGLGSPRAIAGALAMGAAYVMTGSVNQATREAGTSPMVKRMLADAAAHDVAMAPASDMFEAGVKVQVLQRGTMFARRAERLYQLYRSYSGWSEIPAEERSRVEERILGRSYEQVWAECEAFFAERDPEQLERARSDAHHQLALVFRWYLGLSSRWAIGGEQSRRLDTQVWCGPAIGAFNAWTADSFLADPAERDVVTVAANLMTGAAVHLRARWLCAQGIVAGPETERWIPRRVQ